MNRVSPARAARAKASLLGAEVLADILLKV
jgi:hypothetical protein